LIQQFGPIPIHTLEGKKDFSQFSDMLIMSITSMSLDQEISRRRTFSKQKLLELKDSGYVQSKPAMFGYRCGKIKQTVEVIEEEAKIIRQCFRLSDEGMGITAICRATGGRLERSVLRKILRRPAYIGKSLDGRGRLIDSKVYPALLRDEALWKRVQARRKVRTSFPNACSQHHPVSGVLHCGYCGKRMQTSRSQNIWYFCCRNTVCGEAACREDQITALFRAFHFALIKLPVPNQIQGKDVAKLEAARVALLEKEKMLFKSQADLSSQTFLRQSKILSEEIERLENEIRETTQNRSFEEWSKALGEQQNPTSEELQTWIRMKFEFAKIWQDRLEIKPKDREAFTFQRLKKRRAIPFLERTDMEPLFFKFAENEPLRWG
jgi:hypothetical protein